MDKYSLLHDGVPGWWSTLEGARDTAMKEFLQQGKYADFVHVFKGLDFVHPVLTICRKGYAGPASDNRIEVSVA